MKIIKLSFLICLCIITLLSNTLCWKNEGHMIIASIVKQDLLNNKRSDVLDFINQLSKMVTELQHEKVSSYLEVVTWPDEVKRYFMAFLNSSHSNHIPFNNTDNSNDFIDLKSNNVDVYNTYFNGIRTTQNSLSFLVS